MKTSLHNKNNKGIENLNVEDKKHFQIYFCFVLKVCINCGNIITVYNCKYLTVNKS